MSAVLESLRAKMAEQAELVAVLEMWEKVEAQGISADDVAGFTFRDEYLSRAQERQRLQAQQYRLPDPFVDGDRPKQYNAVRMKDGTIRKLDPIIQKPH